MSGARQHDHKYLAVRSYLTTLISTELTIGDAVPSERALTEMFGVSRMTVRQALDTLVADGILQRKQGRGTFVAPQRVDFEMRLTTFGENARRRGWIPGTEVLDMGTVPTERTVAEALGCPDGTPMHHLVRLRSGDGEPMCIERAWIPAALIPDLLADGAPESLYATLREHALGPTWGEETILADEAGPEEIRLLQMRTVAVMRTERRTFCGDVPVMFSRTCFRGDRYSVFVPLREPKPTIVPRPRSDARVEPDSNGRTTR